MCKVRVLLADDHEGILAWVRAVLTLESDAFEIVGTVRDGRDAVEQVQHLDPDVLVIDISMPSLDGLQAVSRLSSNCRTKVVFLTLHEGRDFVAAAFAAGASAYVLKLDMAQALVPAIREVLQGRTYISPSLQP